MFDGFLYNICRRQTTLYICYLLGCIYFCISPFLFQKRFRKAFSENATVSFFSDYFSIDFKEINTDAIVKTDINRFDQIKFFKIYDSTENDFLV